MDRRVALTAAVAVLLALAGCSALPMWDDNGATPTPEADGVATPTETATPEESAPAADPDAGEGDGPEDANYPEGYGPGGLEDPGTATAAHVDALVGFESYLFQYQSRLDTDEGDASFTYVTTADNEGEVAYVIQDTGQLSQASYFEDDRVYIRQESDGEVEYNATDREYEMSEFAGVQFVAPLHSGVEYGDAEIIETDDGTFFQYTSDDVTDPEAILQSDVDEDRIERFDVAIVVDTDGAIRSAAFAVEADNDVTAQMAVGEVGSTNVDRPEWFDEADET